MLSAVVWVGGMAFALLVLRPALPVSIPPQSNGAACPGVPALLPDDLARDAALLLTGYWMLFGLGGFVAANWDVHMMHLLGLAMAAVFVAIWFGPYQRFRAGQGRAMSVIRPMIFANMLLGLATVVIAALG